MTDELRELEAMMARQRLRVYPSTADSDLFALPRMVDIYVGCWRDLGKLPTQDRFLDAVVAACPALSADGVRARASRTYPAFVRQQHFATALKVYTTLEGVHWIPALDYLGVDLLVLDHGHALGVALSLKTDRAAYWQNVKQGRHPRLGGLVMLELDLDPAEAPRLGPFWVHPLSDVWQVQEAVQHTSVTVGS